MNKKPLIDKHGGVRELPAEDLKKFDLLSERNPALYAKIKKGAGESAYPENSTKTPVN